MFHIKYKSFRNKLKSLFLDVSTFVHTAVAYFYGVAVENFMQFIGLQKMFVDKAKKSYPMMVVTFLLKEDYTT